jgi:flagellar L-ring protein precursor FlgH
VENKDQRSLTKETDTSGTVDLSHSASGIYGSSVGALAEKFGVGSKRDFGGNSAFSSERAFSDRITVTVIDVLPNGNLVVSGRRQVNIEGDARGLVVSGIVRTSDIRPDNTISSRFVSGLDMRYEGRGAESRFINQGWMGRATNLLWPF